MFIKNRLPANITNYNTHDELFSTSFSDTYMRGKKYSLI